jgi:GTP-binding protein
MNIKTARFIRGIAKKEDMVTDGIPQVLFMGRSNVGKSSVINSFTGKKNMAISSSTPGRTQEINLFLINNAFYLADLPGYGYAAGSVHNRKKIMERISWYVFSEHTEARKIVLIVDAEIGVTEDDTYILQLLEEHGIDIIIVANKADKLKSGKLKEKIDEISKKVGTHQVIEYSAKKNTGIGQLTSAILSKKFVDLSKIIKITKPSREIKRFEEDFKAYTESKKESSTE